MDCIGFRLEGSEFGGSGSPSYKDGCQNYSPFLDPYYNTAPNMQGTQRGIITLTTTHIDIPEGAYTGGL